MSGAVVGVVEIIAGVIIDIASEGYLSPLGDGLIAAGASTLLGYAASLLLNPHRQTLVPIGAAFSGPPRGLGFGAPEIRRAPQRAPDRGYLRDLAILAEPRALRLPAPALVAPKAAAGEPRVRLYGRSGGGKIFTAIVFGDCLAPIIPKGTHCWFEEGPWGEADFCWIRDERAGTHYLKQLSRANGLTIDGARREGWVLVSNLPPMWLMPHHRVIGRLVCSLHGLPAPAEIEDLSHRARQEGAQLAQLVEERLRELPRALHA